MEWLNRNPEPSAPGRCARCRSERTWNAIVVPFGVGEAHTWLHPECWPAWHQARRANAVAALIAAGILAIIYTSPSHTEASPRWRVLAPLSQPWWVRPRGRFLARLNGVFGGVFANESWTLSQSYYYGSVKWNPSHRVVLLDGTPIDRIVTPHTCVMPAGCRRRAVRSLPLQFPETFLIPFLPFLPFPREETLGLQLERPPPDRSDSASIGEKPEGGIRRGDLAWRPLGISPLKARTWSKTRPFDWAMKVRLALRQLRSGATSGARNDCKPCKCVVVVCVGAEISMIVTRIKNWIRRLSLQANTASAIAKGPSRGPAATPLDHLSAIPPAALPAAGHLGMINELSARHVEGWMQSPSSPDKRVDYEIVLSDTNEVLARGTADEFRHGLGVGDGAHGFLCQLPTRLDASEQARIVVRPAGGGTH